MRVHRGRVQQVGLAAQRTIVRAVALDGRGGFSGAGARLLLCPAPLGTGIVVQHRGGTARISHEALTTDAAFRHTTCLKTPGGTVRTVEHLLAAAYAFGITNMVINTDARGHVPFFDGSSRVFCENILAAGIVEQEGVVPVFAVTRAFEVSDGATRVAIHPNPGGARGLTLDVEIDFARPIGRQRLLYDHTPLNFALWLASARTFLSVPWEGELIKALPGFRHKDADGSSNMVTHDGFGFRADLRAPDECVRHKALDLIGDLAVLGVPLDGHVVARRPGHAATQALVSALGDGLPMTTPCAHAG